MRNDLKQEFFGELVKYRIKMHAQLKALLRAQASCCGRALHLHAAWLLEAAILASDRIGQSGMRLHHLSRKGLPVQRKKYLEKKTDDMLVLLRPNLFRKFKETVSQERISPGELCCQYLALGLEVVDETSQYILFDWLVEAMVTKFRSSQFEHLCLLAK